MLHFHIKPVASGFASVGLLLSVAGAAHAASLPQACAAESLVYSFGDSTLRSPRISLGADDSIYVSEPFGGINTTGRILRVTPAGQLTVAHDFAAIDPGSPSWLWANADGVSPDSAPISAGDGNLYGTTEFGGANGQGAIYRIAADGKFALLHEFAAGDDGNDYLNADGERPVAALSDGGDGYLYGSAFEGGSNGSGTIFRVATDGGFQLLYTFTTDLNAGYVGPETPLVRGADGNFYGTYTRGLLFRYSLNSGWSDLSNDNGLGYIVGLNHDASGGILGATQDGGANGRGSIFTLNADGSTTTIHSFGNGRYNRWPMTPVVPPILGRDGRNYGTTYQGGKKGDGTFYRLNADGTIKVLFNFAGSDAILPGGVVQATDGSFYVITIAGGASNQGALLRLTLNPGC